MKRLIPFTFLLFLAFLAHSQQTQDSLSIPQKFDYIYRTSTSYQEYKVVSKARYQALKQQVSDSLNDLKEDIRTKDLRIQSQKDSIQNISQIAATFESDYRQTLARTHSINFLGIEFHKSTYNTIVWSLIGILLILLGVFMYRFKNSHVVTTQAKNELSEVEEEFALHKKKTLEREQKLRRQLQDEINKQRGV